MKQPNIYKTYSSFVISKGTVGSLFSGIASKFGRTATFLEKVGTMFPSTAETLDKVADSIQSVTDTLNSYKSILQPFKDIINNIKGYTKLVETCMELEDLGGSCSPDVVETVTSGITSCSNIAGAEECMTGVRDMIDLIEL